LHTYAVKSPLVTMARPKFVHKSTSSRGPIPKPHYLPHPWTRPTYGTKQHPDLIRRFLTMHWTDRPTDRALSLSLISRLFKKVIDKRNHNTIEKKRNRSVKQLKVQ